MSFIIPKKQILYAPMLGSLGGGSARGFGRGVGSSDGPLVAFTNTGTGRSGSVQNWTVPKNGDYKFEAFGAMGGSQANGNQGGSGMRIMTNPITLTSGTIINIMVGQAGLSTSAPGSDFNNAGGGGGTFMWNASNNSLYVAAGGGGGAASVDYSYKNASETTSGQNGFGHTFIDAPTSLGGLNGQGGHHGDGDNRGAGGAGWLSNGKPSSGYNPSSQRTANRPLANGLGGTGGTDAAENNASGGYGGGGGGGNHGIPAYGGGGGGYSGGGGGSWDSESSGPGGGGGSYSSSGLEDYALHANLHGSVNIYV